MTLTSLAAGAAVLTLAFASGALAAEAPAQAPPRTRAEACSLIKRMARGPDQFADASANGKRAAAETRRIARQVRHAVCDGGEVAAGPDGSQYFGEARDGQPDGYGARFYADGVRYVGQWKAGQREGQGVLMSPGGSRYVGGFDKDAFHGKGVAQSLWLVRMMVVNKGDKPR